MDVVQQCDLLHLRLWLHEPFRSRTDFRKGLTRSRRRLCRFIYSDNMMKSSKVDLVGFGLNATDTVIPLANYPVRGSKVEFSAADVLPGGQVASTVVACQLWGMSTRYVGSLGDDSAATLHHEAFADAGVETQI